jgi:hypothetical protein
VHSEVGASVKAGIVQCPGMVRLVRPYLPRPDTEETLEGNVADWVAQRYQAGFNVLAGTKPIDNGPPVDDEMIRGGILWRDTVGREGVTQMMLVCETLHPLWLGTPDHWRWNPQTRELWVHEYKYGHRFVDAYECYQLTDYATAILDAIGEGQATDIVIHLIVVQPRYYAAEPVREWKLNSGQLRAYTNISHAATVEALGDNPRCRTGPACFDCAASHSCETLAQGVSHAVQFVGRAQSVAIPVESISTQLELINKATELLEAQANGLRAQAEAYFFRGKRIVGQRMKHKEGRLKWVAPVADVIAAAQAQGVNVVESTEPHVCTPTQAINRGMSVAVVDTLATRPPRGWELVRDDGTEANKRFGK